MSDGRTKETQRGLGTPQELRDVTATASATVVVTEPNYEAAPRSDVRTEPVVGHLRVVAPASGTPIVTAAKATNARSAGTPAAAAYVEPKTPPPVRPQRSDTVAVLLSDDIDPQKVPTEPSLSRRREPSAWSDIELLPQVKYRNRGGTWHWLLVAAFGGAVGYWVYWGAAQEAAPARPRASVLSQGADSVNPSAFPQTTEKARLASGNSEPTILLSGAGTPPAPLVAPSGSEVAGERSVSNGKASASAEVSAQPPAPSVEKNTVPTQNSAPAAERPAGTKPAAEPGKTPKDVWLQ